ncbi:executer 1 [Dionaea muscipula]
MAVASPWVIGGQIVPFPKSCCSFTISRALNPRQFLQLHMNCCYRNRKNSNLSCRCSVISSSSGNANGGTEWDWNRWTRHFSEIEQTESYVSVLKFQLEEAVEKEDFLEAAKLKSVIAEATSKDLVAEIMSELKKAIDEERYQDASKLSRRSGSGLVGWWVGCSSADSGGPFGRLVRITPGVGRFIGRSYTPRQLVTASPGTPLFEIFVAKGADNTYMMKVVYLQRTRGNSTSSLSMPQKPTKEDDSEKEKEMPQKPTKEDDSEKEEETTLPSIAGAENTSLGIQGDEDQIEKQEKSRNIENASTAGTENISLGIHGNEDKIEKQETIEGASLEGIKSVISFLKGKIPILKLKVVDMEVTAEVIGDSEAPIPTSQEEVEEIGESSEDEAENLNELQPDEITVEGDDDTVEDENDLGVKVFVGGVLHNSEDVPAEKDEFLRLPAEIKDMARDSFLLHIPGVLGSGETKKFDMKVAALIGQRVSELMPPEVAKAFLGTDKVSSKVTRDVREILKLAVSHARKRKRLSEYTTFTRLGTSNVNLDPFDGLYVGAFGPYGTEVVQLRRKFGQWNNGNGLENPSDVEFFEYVEAVKLTGDLNVPAGEVTFRAKIGKGSRISNRGLYPDELGVVASYRGQGRIAELGFRNPKWVEGELLQLNSKGIGPFARGADLGFLYTAPEQSFLVLFNRLNLPE